MRSANKLSVSPRKPFICLQRSNRITEISVVKFAHLMTFPKLLAATLCKNPGNLHEEITSYMVRLFYCWLFTGTACRKKVVQSNNEKTDNYSQNVLFLSATNGESTIELKLLLRVLLITWCHIEKTKAKKMNRVYNTLRKYGDEFIRKFVD